MNIRLEPLTRGDFPEIRSWIDPGVFRIFETPVDDQQLDRLLSKELHGIPTDIGMRAVDAETNGLVGVIHAVINRKNDFAHIQQIVIDPTSRSQGIGAGILELFLELCFTQHRLHRVQLFTDEDNKVGISCYKKVGFRVDGYMRDIIKTDAGYLSEYVFSMLCDEWRGEGGASGEATLPRNDRVES